MTGVTTTRRHGAALAARPVGRSAALGAAPDSLGAPVPSVSCNGATAPGTDTVSDSPGLRALVALWELRRLAHGEKVR